MQTNIRLRAYQPADAAQVVALINANAEQTIGVPQAVVDAAGNVRLARYVPPSSQKVVALNQQAQPVGYAYFVSREQGIVNEMGGAVHPAYWGNGIGALLVEWALQQALTATHHAPAGIKTVLQTFLFERQAAAQRLFQARGFQQVREWAHYVIDLQAHRGPPQPATDLQIEEMDLEQDWDMVGPVLDLAFMEHWGAIILPPDPPMPSAQADPDDQSADVRALVEDSSYSNSAGFCFMARAGHTVVGGILCNAKLVERSDSGRIGSLFVHPAYQRRGIGRALMQTAFAAFWQHGLRRVILDTDAQSFAQSPLFYTSLGMRQYRREWVYERTIRSGREIRRLEA